MLIFPSFLNFPKIQFAVAMFCVLVGVAIAQDGGTGAQPSTAPSAAVPSSSVTIVFDNSRAARNRVNDMRKAAIAFSRSFSTRDEVALFFAGDKPTLAQEFTGDTSLIEMQLKRLKTGGKLALFDTLARALDHARSDSANEHTAVVAFVNDLDLATPEAASAVENSIRQRAGVPVFIMALRNSSWRSQEQAQRIAILSGGVAYFPSKSSELPKIADAIASRLGGSTPEALRAQSEPPVTLENYNVLLVRDIPVADNPNTAALPGGDNYLLHRVLLARLAKAKLFNEVRDATELGSQAEPVSGTGAVPAGGELELLPMIVSYKGGIQGAGDLIRPFASPKLRVQVVLRDRNTRQPISSFTEEASGAAGLLKGSDEKVQAEAMSNVCNKIVDHLKEMKPQKKNSKKEEQQAAKR